jgi:hypothetical protein
MERHVELVRKQTYITPQQDAALKRIAAREGTTESEVLRRVLDKWLVRVEHASDDPLGAFVGWAEGDVVNDHDDIYRDPL